MCVEGFLSEKEAFSGTVWAEEYRYLSVSENHR